MDLTAFSKLKYDSGFYIVPLECCPENYKMNSIATKYKWVKVFH